MLMDFMSIWDLGFIIEVNMMSWEIIFLFYI